MLLPLPSGVSPQTQPQPALPGEIQLIEPFGYTVRARHSAMNYPLNSQVRDERTSQHLTVHTTPEAWF